MGRGAPWLVAALCAALGGGLWAHRLRQVEAAGSGAAALIQRAWQAEGSVALEGRQRITVPGAGGRAVEVEAMVLTSGAGQKRIEYLTAPLRGVTIWESGERTYRYSPAERRVTVSPAREPQAARSEREAQLLRNYRVRPGGREVVAGQQVSVVELRPKSGSDRWKRYSVDPLTSVILASEERQGRAGVLWSTRFTQVTYLDEEPPAERFVPPAELLERFGAARAGEGSSRFTPERLSRLVGFRLRLPATLPRGYALEGAYQVACACGERHQAARLEYRDGLNTMSLFQCAHPRCGGSPRCFGTRGADAVHAERDGVSYLAVGDLRPEELRRVLRSMK